MLRLLLLICAGNGAFQTPLFAVQWQMCPPFSPPEFSRFSFHTGVYKCIRENHQSFLLVERVGTKHASIIACLMCFITQFDCKLVLLLKMSGFVRFFRLLLLLWFFLHNVVHISNVNYSSLFTPWLGIRFIKTQSHFFQTKQLENIIMNFCNFLISHRGLHQHMTTHIYICQSSVQKYGLPLKNILNDLFKRVRLFIYLTHIFYLFSRINLFTVLIYSKIQ